MRPFAVCALALIPMLAVAADPPARAAPESRTAERLRMLEIEDRVNELRPVRRDSPLRELNISDNEIREIQALAQRYKLSSMLNISPVIAGCSCEEGPLCTDQVWVVAETPPRTIGVQLSRIRNAWVVGPVQQWWLQYESLRVRMPTMDFRAYLQEKNSLLLEFPMCVGKDGPDKMSTALSREMTK